MKQSLALTCILATSFMLSLPTVMAADEVKSLRGAASLDADSTAPAIKQWEPDQEPIERDFVQQPPLIPHSVEGDKINRKVNKCLSCHGWTKYKEAGATKISQTHFADRDENVLANIAPRRYFCDGCHVPQRNVKPAINNTFQPVPAIHQP